MSSWETEAQHQIDSSDSEFIERARHNLERADALPNVEIEISHGENRADMLTAELEALFDTTPPQEPTEKSPGTTQALQELVRKAAQRYGPGGEIGQQQYEQYAAALAAEQRRKYRARIMKDQGREVRRILSDPKARAARRAECERKRYADKKGSPVRPYRKLDHMTDAERAAYKKEQKREAQRRRRLEKKDARGFILWASRGDLRKQSATGREVHRRARL